MVPREIIRDCDTKIIDRESWSSYYPKYFWFPNVSETHKGSPTEVSATVRQKILNQKSL